MNIRRIVFFLLLAFAPHLGAQTVTVTNPVTSGLQLWLNPDTIDITNTNFVTLQSAKYGGTYYLKYWPNGVNNSYGCGNPVASQEPLLFPNHVNGHSLLQFNGKTLLNTNLPEIAGNKTIFIVEDRMDTQTRAEIGSTATSGGLYLANSGGYESVGRTNIAVDATVPGHLNNLVLKCFERAGSLESLTVNGVSTTVTVPDAAAGFYSIGSGYSGLITEALFYNRALSTQECQEVENYLSEKYSLWGYELPDQNGLQFWLAADAIQGATGVYPTQELVSSGTNLFVTNWLDGSASGLSAYMPVTAYSPLLIQNALNGWPVVSFSGTNFLLTNLPQISGDKSIFEVHSATGNWGEELSSDSEGSGLFLAGSAAIESKGRLGISSSDEMLASPGDPFVVKSFIRSGTNETLSVNDASTTASVADDAYGNYTLSSGIYPFQGQIAEMIIYNRAVSPAESGTIENYLSAKWSYPPSSIFSVPQDLQVPPTTNGTPGPGLRVRQTAPTYTGTSVYHTLYLPTDWQPGKTYPVIVEYPPNGPFSDSYGDTTTGNVEDCSMGYGLTGGQGYIWISMPLVGGSPLANQQYWWGNMATTEDYCIKAINYVCQNYGGDSSSIILTGFSRGGIACNYVGLYDSTISDTWLAFIPHSGYDGQYTNWGYPYDDSASALARLQRLGGRWQHISNDYAETSPQGYLQSTGVSMAPFTFRTLPYVNHTGLWTETPIQLRRDTRAWLAQVVAQKPGTFYFNGTVLDKATGQRLPNVLIQTGSTHFTTTAANGTYTMAGLLPGTRTVTATAPGYTFAPQKVTISGTNVGYINFVGTP